MSDQSSAKHEPVTRRELCAALGFFAVILRDNHPPLRTASDDARLIADLLEGFCTLDSGWRRAAAQEATTEEEEEAIMRRYGPPHRMAAAIIAYVKKHNQACTPSALFAEGGFTQAEIDRFWVMAYALAQVHLIGENQNQ